MTKRSRTTTIKLVGGLGNQLFGYFAGLYLKQVKNIAIAFEIGAVRGLGNFHGSSLESFDIKSELLTSHTSNSIVKRVARMLMWPIVRRSTTLRRLYTRILGMYVSSDIGFDPELDEVPLGTLISGYFQTFKYVESVLKSGFEFPRLRNASIWYQEMEKLILTERPIVLHVRRGDYALQKNSYFGQLSESYYLNGLAALGVPILGSEARIWIFSDEIKKVRSEFKSFESELVRWIEAPLDADPAEELMLMSKGSARVISNSTFAWWSAILSNSGSTVVPQRWFRGRDEPRDLIPDNWIRVESSWKDDV